MACRQPPSAEEMEEQLHAHKAMGCLNLREASEGGRGLLDNVINELRVEYRQAPMPRTGWTPKMFDNILAILDSMRKPCLVFSATGLRALAVCVAHRETRYLCGLRVREPLERGIVDILIQPERLKLLEIVSERHLDEGFSCAFLHRYISAKIETAQRRPLFARVNKSLYIGPQPCEAELKELAGAGLRTVVCLRDYAEAGALGVGVLAREGEVVRGLGMMYMHDNVPASMAFAATCVEETRKWFQKAKKPMLVHDSLSERVTPLYSDQPVRKKKGEVVDVEELEEGTVETLFVPKFNLTVAQICEKIASEAPKPRSNPTLQRAGASKGLTTKNNAWVADDAAITIRSDTSSWRPASPRRKVGHVTETVGLLACSFAVGVVADIGRVALPVVVRGQLALARSHLVKVLCASGAASSLLLALLAIPGQPPAQRLFSPWRSSSLAIAGTCPDLVLVQVGSGVPSSGFAFLGCWTGAALFSVMLGTPKPITAENKRPILFEQLPCMGCGHYTPYAFILAVLLGAWYVLLELSNPWRSEGELLGLENLEWAPWVMGAVLGALQLVCVAMSGHTYGGSTCYMACLARLLLTRRLQTNFWLGQIEQFRLGRGFWMMRFYMVCVVCGSYTSSVALGTNNLMVGVSPWEAWLGGFIGAFGSRMANGMTCLGGLASLSALCVHAVLAAGGMACGGLAVAQVYNVSNVDFAGPEAFYDAAGGRNASVGQAFLGF